MAMKARKFFKTRDAAVWVDDASNIWVRKKVSRQGNERSREPRYLISSEEDFTKIANEMNSSE